MWIPLPTSIERARRPAFLFGLFVAMSVGTPALAEPTSQERSLAAALFEEGRALMAKGLYSEACPKLAESHRLDPGGGTLLNLALCHEREGKIATAWVEFREAQAMARKDNRPEREAAAAGELRKIEPNLSRLSIIVPAEVNAPGLTIKLDGAVVAPAAWGTKIPIDPGKHSILAEAPGRRPFEAKVDVGPSASEPTVTLMPLTSDTALSDKPIAGPSAVSAQPDLDQGAAAPAGSGRRVAGYVIGGLGLVGLGVGAGFGVMAINKQSASDDICSGTSCPQAAVTLNEQARGFATASNVAIGVGLAGLLAGTILVLTAPRQKKVAVGVSFERGGGGVSLRGAF